MKLSKQQLKRHFLIIKNNIKHYKKCIDKCKTDKNFNKTWNIKDFEDMLLFWQSVNENFKIVNKK